MRRGKYTVNEVEERTSVPASTLRQWERRYGFPKPERSRAGYRLYSEMDLGHIDAMKRHIAEGIPASRAAQLVRGNVPRQVAEGRPLVQMREELVAALAGLDEEAADRLLSEAFALHPIDGVVLQLLAASMESLGEMFERGAIEAGVVGAAASWQQGRLRALLAQAPVVRAARPILIGCAPGNFHELGPLTLTLLLRRAGFRAHYLGPDIAISDLALLAQRLRPVAVALSAATAESAAGLGEKPDRLQDLAPIVALGGAGFVGQVTPALDGLVLAGEFDQALHELRERVSSEAYA